MSKWFFALVQFAPLSLFAGFAFGPGVGRPDRWTMAYMLGAVAASIQLLLLFRQPRPANRLLLGANLYLLGGGIAVLSRQWWYLDFYGMLQESAIFLFILGVGIATTLKSSSGFIGVTGPDLLEIRRYSAWLIAATVLAGAASVVFKGNQKLSAVMPLVVLTVLQRLFASRLQSSAMHNQPLQPTRAQGKEI